MKKYILSILLLIISFSGYATSTPVSQLAMDHVPITDQLPYNSVNRFFQDKEGFIWLGTFDGLCRYDGYRVLTFRSNTQDPDLLTNNEITAIAEDSCNRLWIGTKKGMNILDKRTYTITPLDIPALIHAEIKSIFCAADGTIWVGTNQDLIRFDADGSLRKIYNDVVHSSVNAIYTDKQGKLWITVWNHGLHRYNPEEDSFIALPPVGNRNNPFQVFQDKDDNFWILTWGDGIYRLSQDDAGDFSYEKPTIDNYTFTEHENRFFSITQDDKNGYLWLASTIGLYAFDFRGNNTLHKIDIASLLKKTNNIFSEIIKDKEGNLWISSFGDGIFTINFKKPFVRNYAMPDIKAKTGFNPYITSLCADNQGNIWFNQNRFGLGILDTKTGIVKLFHEYPEIKHLKELNFVNCVSGFRSLQNEIWIALAQNAHIYSLSKTNGKIKINRTIDLEQIAPNTIINDVVTGFFEDRRNNIWIITNNDKILVRNYHTETIKPIDISLKGITDITEDVKGNIWLSTSHDGLYCVSLVNNNIDHLKVTCLNTENSAIPSNHIETVCAGLNGLIWIGTKEGHLLSYNLLNGTFEEHEFVANYISERIMDIIADQQEHIWIVTNKRVIELNPESSASRTFSNRDGVLVNSFLKNSHFISKSGKIFFGGHNGISAFTSSEDLVRNPSPILVSLTDVEINNKSVLNNNGNTRFDVIDQKITLQPKDRNIEIHFSTLNHSFPSKIRYAYKMKGTADDWVYTDRNRQSAVFNQLKRGTHIFELKATDENGNWSEPMKFTIYRRPAFYETWWAFTLYFILLIAGLYTSVNIIRKRLKLRNELKIAKIEKEKSEELTQSKLQYFTNISHDLLTPLTIVSCLIDDAEMTHKEKINQLEPMRTNIQRLRRLLRQILDFRKVESGNMKLKLSYGDIVVFIKDICFTNFEPIMQKKQIKFDFSSTHNQILGYFDPDKIDKVVFNLLSNAHKYTPEGGEVKVALELIDENKLLIQVSDTGIGISEKEQELIFTRFYTGEGQKIKDSNGIGLSLTKDLIELHRGSIQVTSAENKGTTFNIIIPIDQNSYSTPEIEHSNLLDVTEKEYDEDISDNTQEDSEEKHSGTDPEEPINLLLVEDNEELSKVISKYLSKFYRVYTATNGIAALNIVRENDIDIMVSDVMMPEMDGFELTKEMKTNVETSHIPILLLTAKNSTEDRIASYNAGADGYMSKPFEIKVLHARVENFISHRRKQQKKFVSNFEVNLSTLEYTSFNEQFLTNAIKIIEENLDQKDLDVNTLSEKLFVSKSTLYRKIKTMTGLSPNEFVRNIRLKHACTLLKNQSVSITEVATIVGFSDPKYFTLCFKNEFNMTPRKYQKLEAASDEEL